MSFARHLISTFYLNLHLKGGGISPRSGSGCSKRN